MPEKPVGLPHRKIEARRNKQYHKNGHPGTHTRDKLGGIRIVVAGCVERRRPHGQPSPEKEASVWVLAFVWHSRHTLAGTGWPSAKPSPLVPYGLGYQLQSMRAFLHHITLAERYQKFSFIGYLDQAVCDLIEDGLEHRREHGVFNLVSAGLHADRLVRG